MRKLTATILAGAASLAAFTAIHAQGGPARMVAVSLRMSWFSQRKGSRDFGAAI